MITIKEMTSKKELKTYVQFPFKLYKNSKYWVPPIINEELESFDKTINPVFQHAEARFFVAIKNDEIVGRIAAIINYTEIKEQKVKKMRFGWFDFIDDIEDILAVPLLGVIPESQAVLNASNSGNPVILDEKSDAGQAYKDTVARLLGEELPHRFLEAQKKGILKRVFGG